MPSIITVTASMMKERRAISKLEDKLTEEWTQRTMPLYKQHDKRN